MNVEYMNETPQSQKIVPDRLAGLWLFWVLAAGVLVLRLLYAASLQLVPDEAYYWVWSRHPALGYFDHPPMIAYIMWLGTRAAGTTELGVRLIGVVMGVGAMVVIVVLARRVLRDERATLWVALIWLTSPMLTLTGLIITPDVPAIFFGVCALALAGIIADIDDHPNQSRRAIPWLWLAFGLFTGLAFDSKYPAVLPAAGAAIAFLFSRRGIAHFRRPWIYLGAIVALLAFMPVVLWNAQHHWASFVYQLHHGTSGDAAATAPLPARVVQLIKDLGVYIGQQVGVWTPILFVIALVLLAYYWVRYRQIGQVDRVMLWTGTLPLVVFGAAALKAHHTEANWPTFAYFPISILTGRWVSRNWSNPRVNWVKGGIQLAGAIVIGLYVILLPPVTASILKLPLHAPHNLKDLTGWREDGRTLGAWAEESGSVVMCNRHQDAGEAAFYIPGQPDVWCVGVGFRPTAYDYFDEPRDFAKIARILWVGGHEELFCKKYGFRVLYDRRSTRFVGRKNARTLSAYVLVRTKP